jgi:hypothetical protein
MLKYLPDVRDIATNDKDWTILNFKDGEKVIVKCSQAYDLEKGILYAYAKKHRKKKMHWANLPHISDLRKDINREEFNHLIHNYRLEADRNDYLKEQLEAQIVGLSKYLKMERTKEAKEAQEKLSGQWYQYRYKDY